MTELDSQTIAKIESYLSSGVSESYPVSEETIQHWTGVLPDTLIEVWKTYGFVTLAEGRLQLLDPRYLAPIISYIVEGDPDLDGDTYPIAYGKLGEVVVWSQRHGLGMLSPTFWTLHMYFILDENPPSAHEQMIKGVLTLTPKAIEAFDPQEQPVFERLVKKLGPLSMGEIYGSTPVPKPSGGTPLDDYVVADVIEWLEVFYGGIRVSLVDWNRKKPILRRVRDPWPPGMQAAQREIKK